MIESPKIYNIPASEDFFINLTQGIIDKFLISFNTKDVIILLPTKRACASLKSSFVELGYKNLNIHSISDLSNLVTLKEKSLVLSRIGMVAKISKIILKMNLPKYKDLSSITPLAEYFANFIYSLELYKIDLNQMIKVIDEDLSIHQQELFLILKSFVVLWIEEGNISKAGYNNLLMEEFSNNLANKALIMAGISYNTPSIIQLMKKACVVFYGLDSNFNQDDWNNVDITHGQYNFKQILSQLNVNTQTIECFSKSFNARLDLLSAALKPSSSCANWHNIPKDNIDRIKYLECNDSHHEAKSIVELLQNNSDKTVMVVTADDSLMVKIILNLRKNNLDANLIRDYPLRLSNTGIWLELCLNVVLEEFSLVSSLALLKHNFANIDQEVLAEIELVIRDKNFYGNSVFSVSIDDENFNLILESFKNLKDIFSCRSINFKELFEFHISFAQAISKSSLWEDPGAEELKLYLDQVLENAEILGHIVPKIYPKIFKYFLQSAYYRPEISNYKITLSKPRDARLHRADLVILAGLNEGVWPSKPSLDPCFNSNLFRKMGLPYPEQMIGEEAYDFQCFIHSKQVILTRSEKNLGVITTPSRWLLRVLTLIEIESIVPDEFIIDDGGYEPYEIFSPSPPLEYRPSQLSVTQIDKLVFNPYHIYVDLILKLKKFSPFRKELTALDFGVFIHRALEIYSNQFIKLNLEVLLKSGKQALVELNLNSPKLQLVYWQRFIRIAKWFVANEDLSKKSYLEAYGKILIGKDFVLIARADRVDISSNNSLHIIDYKTGRLPTNKAITSGKNLQLLLEGLVGKNGGFYFQKEHQNLESLTYLQLSGGEDPVEILEIEVIDNKIIEQAEEYIYNLIEQYQDPSTSYYYTEKKKIGYCEYAHLARVF